VNPIPHLKVSGKAHELSLRVFQHTRGRAWSHEAVLRERLQRTALAVALHIVRGGRYGARHYFPRAIDAALAAERDLVYCLLVARDLGLLTMSSYATLEARAAELERMLVGLRHRLRASGSAARSARAFPLRSGSGGVRQPLQLDGVAQPTAPESGAPLGVG
jgi:four helix bundle protein